MNYNGFESMSDATDSGKDDLATLASNRLFDELASSARSFTDSQQKTSEAFQMTSVIPALPMPGDPPRDYSYTPPSTQAEEEEPRKEKPKHEEDMLPMDPGIISKPSEWFNPKNFGNPFNPIWS